jgi:hypothetical protein
VPARRHPGQAEVDQLGLFAELGIGHEDDVRRLDVAMDDAALVRGVERPTQANREVHRAHPLELVLAPQHSSQRRPGHVLHHEERGIADHEIDEARDVAMLDGGGGHRFLLKALTEGAICEERGLEQLTATRRPMVRFSATKTCPIAPSPSDSTSL